MFLQVFIVTGGMDTSFTYLDSTEIMIDTDQGSWVSSGAKLPRPMDGLRAANIDGRVLFFGNIIHMYILYYLVYTIHRIGTYNNLQVVVIVIIMSIMIMITFWSTTRRRTPLFLGAR